MGRGHAWNTASSYGARMHGRSEDRVTQHLARGADHREARWPVRAGVVGCRAEARRFLTRSGTTRPLETGNCSLGQLCRSIAVARWATTRILLLEEGLERRPEGLAPASRSRPDRMWELQQHRRSSGTRGQKPASSREPARKAPDWTTRDAAVQGRSARGRRASTPEVTRRHSDQCAFSTSPEGRLIFGLRDKPAER